MATESKIIRLEYTMHAAELAGDTRCASRCRRALRLMGAA
jgi:hypothetical protein